MKPDRSHPLSNYFSTNGISVSDWGLDDSFPGSLSTYEVPAFPNQFHEKLNTASPTLVDWNDRFSEKHDYNDFASYYRKFFGHGIVVDNRTVSAYISKYLSLGESTQKFWDEFKYNLVISNLLDDSMILSKNQQLLAALQSQRLDQATSSLNLMKTLNNDGTILKITGKKYSVSFKHLNGSSSTAIYIIYLIIFLLKRLVEKKNKDKRPSSSLGDRKLFKILLIASTKLIQFKRFELLIRFTPIMKRLKTFLINNYQMNKSLICATINLKQLDLLRSMKPSKKIVERIETSKSMVNSMLDILEASVKHSIKHIIPFLNGPQVEKYCKMNGADIKKLSTTEHDVTLTEKKGTEIPNDSSSVKILIEKIKSFNMLRKILVCCLLALNDLPLKSFSTFQIWDLLKGGDNINESYMVNFNICAKLDALSCLLDKQNKILESLYEVASDKEKEYQRSEGEALIDSDILSIDNDEVNKKMGGSESSIQSLVSKLSSITTNLKYFRRYNQVTYAIDNVDELNEKLMIYKLFAEDLDVIKEMYQAGLSELSDQIYSRISENVAQSPSLNSSNRSSKHSSTVSGEFNLKTFHTTNSSSLKKRYSLPSHASDPLPNSPTLRQNPQMSSKAINTNKPFSLNDKKYKRLSTGLQLGLLTVCEEPKAIEECNTSLSKRSGGTNNSKVSYDDNYINILPPSDYYNETYNQEALESLSEVSDRKRVPSSTRYPSSNRFSLNSVSSNISNLSEYILSTQMTSNDGINFEVEPNKQTLSKDDLKARLEESFGRIYNYGDDIKLSTRTSDEPISNSINETTSKDTKELNSLGITSVQDEKFMNNLDKTLNERMFRN